MAPRTQIAMRWAYRALLLIGCGALAYTAVSITAAGMYERWNAPPLSVSLNAPAVPAEAAHRFIFRDVQPIGRIHIERLGLSAVISEGAEGKSLLIGAGHIPGTALPGEPGNVGIAAHRDTFFRALRNMRRGDVIELASRKGTSRYSVEWTRIVRPSDVSVLDRTPEPALTLVTCYPFNFIGSAPNRFIVRAARIDYQAD